MQTMKTTNLTPPLSVNRREMSFYILGGAMLLLTLVVGSLLLWMVNPKSGQSPVVLIGNTNDFPVSALPYRIQLEAKAVYQASQTGVYEQLIDEIWLVHTESGWFAFDRHTPYAFSTRRCVYAWTEANGRFEDPCSGSKFTLDGRLIQPPAQRNLDSYPIAIKNGEIWVDLSQLNLGEITEPLCKLDKSCL
jgi:cytochrome b6-f complex iron-sulfur subunit